MQSLAHGIISGTSEVQGTTTTCAFIGRVDRVFHTACWLMEDGHDRSMRHRVGHRFFGSLVSVAKEQASSGQGQRFVRARSGLIDGSDFTLLSLAIAILTGFLSWRP